MRGPFSKSVEEPQTRRELFRRSGGVLAASAVAEMALPLVHAGESNTIKLALVGCGGRGTGAAGERAVDVGRPGPALRHGRPVR